MSKKSPLHPLICIAMLLGIPPICPSAPGQTSQHSNPMLHQQGTRIVDGDAHEVRLRGVNLGGWLLWEGWIFGKGILTSETTIRTRLEQAVGVQDAQAFRSEVQDNFITESDIQRIAQTGFNCVRLPLNHRLFESDRGWQLLDRLLGWCEKNHVYIILNLTAVPGGQSKLGMADPGDARHLVWASEENQNKTVAIWKAIAARYRNRQIIAGYDLINESAPPSGEALVSLYQRIIQGVRAEDPNHLILLEGSKFASDFSMFDKPMCENQGYTVHMYTWFGDDRKKNLDRFQALAQRQNVPIWVGEFGENTYDMIRSTVEMYGQRPEINGWAFYTWKKAPTTYPGLMTIKVPKDWQTVMAWIGSVFGGPRPDPATVRSGMREFIEAMKLKNCDYDERMEKALLPRQN